MANEGGLFGHFWTAASGRRFCHICAQNNDHLQPKFWVSPSFSFLPKIPLEILKVPIVSPPMIDTNVFQTGSHPLLAIDGKRRGFIWPLLDGCKWSTILSHLCPKHRPLAAKILSPTKFFVFAQNTIVYYKKNPHDNDITDVVPKTNNCNNVSFLSGLV